jgi:hypothetical protein
MRRRRIGRRTFSGRITPETRMVDGAKGIYEVKLEGLSLQITFNLKKKDIQALPYLAFRGGILSELPGLGDRLIAPSRPVAYLNPAASPGMDERMFLDSVFCPGSTSITACMKYATGKSFSAVVRNDFEKLEEADYPAILVATLSRDFQKIETAAKLAPGSKEMKKILENTGNQRGNDMSWMSRASFVFSRDVLACLAQTIVAALENLAKGGVKT